jgi:hypothetical protein
MPHLESWDLAPISIPTRSRLHSIQPINVGTPLVESFAGYLLRLAGSHALRVSDLTERELQKSIPNFHEPSEMANAINSAGKIAQKWVVALEQFTLRKNLIRLTLVPFAPVLNCRDLMRHKRAWCSQCLGFNSSQEWQQVYEQLIWCLRCVEICPLHKVPLETACPACQREMQPVSAVSRPGFCSRCRHWLGSEQHLSGKAAATDFQIWVSREFGKLLAIPPDAALVRKQSVQNVVVRFVDTISKRNRTTAANVLGCHPSSLRTWYNGRAIPRIPLLLRICYGLNIPLTALATGAAVQLGIADEVPMIEQRLATISEPAPHPFRAIQITMRERLVSSIPEISQPRLGETSRSAAQATSRGGRRPDSVILEILEKALALDVPPPLRHIGLSLGFYSGAPLQERFPDLCHAILRKRDKLRESREIAIRLALEGAIAKEHPPTLQQVAREFDYKSATILRYVDRDLCIKLNNLSRGALRTAASAEINH